MRKKPLYIHSPIYPKRSVLDGYIDRIYESGWLTNSGPLVTELELELKAYLNVPYLVLTCNGTTALQVALRSTIEKGEVLSTAFTFAATGQAISWCGYQTLFADIDSKSLKLDPKLINSKVSDNTKVLLPVSIYGNAEHNQAYQDIADCLGLKLIIDAAHCFGSPTAAQQSSLLCGDAAVLSFHATKIFNTVEGGAIITRHKSVYEKAKQLVNFGMINGTPHLYGTNAKMNEIEAAFGLANLPNMNHHINQRAKRTIWYQEHLQTFVSNGAIKIVESANHSYFPILFKRARDLEVFDQALKNRLIFGRRYFNPLQPGCRPEELPIAASVADRIFCLPLHFEVSKDDILEISSVLEALFDQADVTRTPEKSQLSIT